MPRAESPLSPEIRGNIKFDNVSFAYAISAKDSLSGISLTVREGETLGIIGPTGAGKTTLINLIPRFYDATEGAVYIDDCNVNSMDEHTLRAAVAVVPQKALLFSGTIRDNLLWGKSDATQAELDSACRTARADEFIKNTPNGYDSILGQGGVNLSGGQKQRLSLARALIRTPKILILDDCTSALDADTEARVLSGIRETARGMSVLLISQRISTVMKADRILCLENGLMRGLGTHDELMRICPLYREIYASQIGGEADGN